MKSKFAALAQEHSDCGSAKKGGDLGPFKRGRWTGDSWLGLCIVPGQKFEVILLDTNLNQMNSHIDVHRTLYNFWLWYLDWSHFGRAWSLTSGILSVSTPQAPRHDSPCFQDAEGFWGSSLRSESQWIIWCGIHWFGWTSHFENPMICQQKVQLILGDKDQLLAVQPIDASHLPSHQATSWTKWHLTPRKFGAKIKAATCSTGCCWWGIHWNPGWMGGIDG